MFEKRGQMASMLRNLPKIREEMEKLQQRLGQLTAEGDAGGGMVKAKVNGQMEVLSCTISDEALRGGDKELLEKLGNNDLCPCGSGRRFKNCCRNDGRF